MKSIILNILLLLSFSLMTTLSTMANSYYYFSGTVTNIEDEQGVPFHPIFIADNDSIFCLTTFTDQSGYYYDSVFFSPSPDLELTVYTFDCENEIHEVHFTEPDNMNIANFNICTEFEECQAMFYYEFSMDSNFLVNFYDFSYGNITSWYWDFGDGGESYQQNPVHYYNSTGLFEVCLTIFDSLQECSSTYCEYIHIYDFQCYADFSWSASNENPLQIDFLDLSSENISFWSWDYGDGNYSDEQSPSHVYQYPGEYLTILNVFDSLESCWDQSEQWVFVGDSVGCEASFIATLDTINNTPNVYLFQDESVGNHNNWYWEFGDGQSSYEQNPIHIYEEGGSYEVCLTIFSTAGDQCEDYICQTIETPSYYNFGGHAFLGDYPLNIEENDSSNMAIALLYRKIANQWVYMDSRQFWKFGYYWFANKPEGDYLIRTDLMSTSIEYFNYVAGYYNTSAYWNYAETFTLENSEEFAIDIHLRELTPYTTGIGSISGYLSGSPDCDQSLPVQNQLVYLLNGSNEIIDFEYTGFGGDFNFEGLGYGLYKVRAEMTGKWSEGYDISLDSENPFVSGLGIEIICNTFVGIDEDPDHESDLTISSVYPIPAINYVNIELNTVSEVEAVMEVYNIHGKVIYQKMMNLQIGSHSETIHLNNNPPGLYILQITTNEGRVTLNEKIIIK